MRNLLQRIIHRSGSGGARKLEIFVNAEDEWGGYARIGKDVTILGISSFFEKFGTTAIGCKRYENPTLFAGYYLIPTDPERDLGATFEEERIAVIQQVPIFRDTYKDVIFIKSYPGIGAIGGDIVSLIAKASYLEEVVQDIRRQGGLPVHINSKTPI